MFSWSVLLMRFLDNAVDLFELCECGGRAICEEVLVEGVEWSGYLEVCVERHVVEYLTWDFRGRSP